MVHFVIFLMIIFSSAYADEELPCSAEEAQVCYSTLVFYEGLMFPSYGENETELQNSCITMNSTFKCVLDFLVVCNIEPKCQEECNNTENILESGIHNTGLINLYNDLCGEDDSFRKAYLQHQPCFKKIKDKFSECYNISQVLLYNQKFRNDEEKCCFFSWFQNCYKSSALETCGSEAASFMVQATDRLTGRKVIKLCEGKTKCTEPPKANSEKGIISTISPAKSVGSDKNSAISTKATVNFSIIMLLLFIVNKTVSCQTFNCF